MKNIDLIAAMLASTMLALTGGVFAADWPSYGGDNGSQKYSELDQIDASNVAELTTAWIWESPDNATVAENIANQNYRAVPAGFKATPIVIDGMMYVPSSFGRVVAIDAASGVEQWVFDTEAWASGGQRTLATTRAA
jgi:quinoprotein glucose dehydrogenase